MLTTTIAKELGMGSRTQDESLFLFIFDGRHVEAIGLGTTAESLPNRESLPKCDDLQTLKLQTSTTPRGVTVDSTIIITVMVMITKKILFQQLVSLLYWARLPSVIGNKCPLDLALIKTQQRAAKHKQHKMWFAMHKYRASGDRIRNSGECRK